MLAPGGRGIGARMLWPGEAIAGTRPVFRYPPARPLRDGQVGPTGRGTRIFPGKMAGSALEADRRIPLGVGGRGASEGSDVGRVAGAARGRSGRWGGDRAGLADAGRAGGL